MENKSMNNDTTSFPKYQYSFKSLNGSEEMYVVRSDDFEEFKQEITNVKSLVRVATNSYKAAAFSDDSQPEEIPVGMCATHKVAMKQRSDRTGTKHWYDHREKRIEDGAEVWYQCRGNGWKQG